VGAKKTDLLLSRLGAASLPDSLFDLPNNFNVNKIIVVDMLAYFYLGYRTTSVCINGTEAGNSPRPEVEYQNSYFARGQRHSGWTIAKGSSLSKAFSFLRSFEPITVDAIHPRPQQGAAAISGYQGERTYNNVEPVAESFAGYIVIVSLVGNGVLVKQLPITVADHAMATATVGTREPFSGRLTLALSGASEAEITTAKNRNALDRALVIGDLATIQQAYLTAEQVNQKAADGWTPLMLAVENKQVNLNSLVCCHMD
jgi:hypothetical protein